MKNKKICLIPFYGAIIIFLIINHELKKVGKFRNGLAHKYMFLMGLLGSAGIILTLVCTFAMRSVFNLYESPLLPMLMIGFLLLFTWPLTTLPMIKYANKADKIIEEQKEQTKQNAIKDYIDNKSKNKN